MKTIVAYPQSDFLRDFDEWQTSRIHPDGFEKGKILFSMRYPAQRIFSYRFNRFVCISQAVHQQLPSLIHDRIALRGFRNDGFVPEELLLALHEWYCHLSDDKMRTMPTPDWTEVLPIYDRLCGEGTK